MRAAAVAQWEAAALVRAVPGREARSAAAVVALAAAWGQGAPSGTAAPGLAGAWGAEAQAARAQAARVWAELLAEVDEVVVALVHPVVQLDSAEEDAEEAEASQPAGMAAATSTIPVP